MQRIGGFEIPSGGQFQSGSIRFNGFAAVTAGSGSAAGFRGFQRQTSGMLSYNNSSGNNRVDLGMNLDSSIITIKVSLKVVMVVMKSQKIPNHGFKSRCNTFEDLKSQRTTPKICLTIPADMASSTGGKPPAEADQPPLAITNH
ncbi:hypothetical protein HAX54_040709 [Datura stramonium]|uniref:Uncharacterized protein n=1 Tax=Datura stramonium TaxID=4076 RepID=A0ABS8VN22_DATST|nr:hypothetical protein [Datura stramonium]